MLYKIILVLVFSPINYKDYVKQFKEFDQILYKNKSIFCEMNCVFKPLPCLLDVLPK